MAENITKISDNHVSIKKNIFFTDIEYEEIWTLENLKKRQAHLEALSTDFKSKGQWLIDIMKDRVQKAQDLGLVESAVNK